MQLTLTAVVFAAFLWWFSTGLIFFLNARPAQTFRWSLFGASLILIGALYGSWASAAIETTASAFVAFSCGLLIWGWHTMSYYMGIVTGPRRSACAADCRGLKRFIQAAATSLYHELAIVATVALLVWLTWQQPNQFAVWTFVLLWGMHISAKLNVFFGVRNLNVEFIPERLQYLTSYFRHRPMNLLFPFSVTGGTVLTVLLIQQAMAAESGTLAAAGYLLLATLMALAVIEHWFMILPIPAEALWRWSLNTSRAESAAMSAPQHTPLSPTVDAQTDVEQTALPPAPLETRPKTTIRSVSA